MKVLIEISEKLYKNIVEDTKNGYIGSDIWIAVSKGIPITDDMISRSYLKNLPFERLIHTDFGDTAIPIEEIDNVPTYGEEEDNENTNQDTV